MAINLKKILGVITDVLPLGTTVKSIVKGASSLLLKKAAKKVGIDIEPVLAEAEKMAEYDHEIRKALIAEEKERREHELDFYGRFSELDSTAQKWRSMIRPLIGAGLVGFYLLGLFVQLVQQIFPSSRAGLEFIYTHPDSIVVVTKWVVAFYFTSRGIEKLSEILKR